MNIAVLKEVKDNENRVAMTPEGVRRLVQSGHEVRVQRGAGIGSGFSDEEYLATGGKLNDSPYEIVQKVDLVMKVKEPIEEEYYWLDLFEGKTLFTYLHLSGVDKSLTDKLLERKVTAIAYETVEDSDGTLPLLAPMSDVAGVLAAQYGAHYLQKKYNARGITMGFIPNTDLCQTLVVGGGHVGTTAAITAAGMGGFVTLLDINPAVIERARSKMEYILGQHLFKNVRILKSDANVLAEEVKKADLMIGAVLVAGARAPIVVSEDMIKSMKKGAVIVDVSIDQGGCIWGSRPTSHRHPTFELEGKVYCCVTNMPGQASHQSTQALTSVTLPYLEKIAEHGVLGAMRADGGFAKGLNTHDGYIAYQSVAKDLNMMGRYKAFV